MNDPWFVILTLCHSHCLEHVHVRVMVCATHFRFKCENKPNGNHSKMFSFISSYKRSTNSIAHFRLPMNFHKRLESIDGTRKKQRTTLD